MFGSQMVVRPDARRTTTPRASLRATTPSSSRSGSPGARLRRILTRAPTGKSVTTGLYFSVMRTLPVPRKPFSGTTSVNTPFAESSGSSNAVTVFFLMPG
ncbi:hypothetical protein BH11MYX4_BH11MYX4_22550 [soil metagenome]